jgi:hypothetical protein
MDLYQVLLFVICAGVIIAIALLSKKFGYILPLVLCIFSLLFSVIFFFTQPKPSAIFEEPVVNALHQMGLYLGLLFSLSFFLITFFTFQRKKKAQ